MPSSEKFEGQFQGQDVSVFREVGGHRFTDAECEALLRGEYITFAATSKAGNDYAAVGHLEMDGRFAKFKMDFEYKGPVFADSASQRPPSAWCGHTFTADEIEALKAGNRVHGKFHSKNTGNDFECDVEWTDEDGSGAKRIVPLFEDRN